MSEPVRVYWKTAGQIQNEQMANFILMPFAMLLCAGVIYGIYSMVPELLKNDLGVLVYLIVPVAICVVGFFALFFIGAGSFVEALGLRVFYSAGISFFTTPVLFSLGFFGRSEIALYILYGVVAIAGLVLFHFSLKKALFKNIVKGIFVLMLGAPALYMFVYVSMVLCISAGWLAAGNLLPLPDASF